MIVTTNNRVRELLCYPELSPRDQKDFDYVKGDCTPRFVMYKGQLHDVLDTQILATRDVPHKMGEVVVVKESSPLAPWHRVGSDTHWSGTVYRWQDDGVVVGSYLE